MELFELGQQYADSAETLTHLIQKYTGELRKANIAGDANKTFRLKRTLCDLYQQRDHLRDVSRHLMHYYDIH